MDYRICNATDLSDGMFHKFNHNQSWDKQWVKENNQWVLCKVSKSRKWDQEKRNWIPRYLSEQIEHGGCVIAAFENERLVGFSSIDGVLRGNLNLYANLTMLFVDDRYQGKGIGKTLVSLMKKEASKTGAEKLFVSAIPSEETIAFYLAIGFHDAQERIPEFVDSKEDRLLEITI